MRLFLDDERNPEDVTWITLYEGPYEIVRTQDEFIAWVSQHGIPDVISFDNDLGTGFGEGRDCAKWMCEAVMDGDIAFNPRMRFTVHSKNVVAAEWITQYLTAFWKAWTKRMEKGE